jgi:trk system potassium uptake protein TrkH
MNFGDSIRHAFFQVASVISTTGFATANFDLWPETSKIVLVILMFIGGCAGSTGGGIKVSRIIILAKGVSKELRTLSHPKQVRKITVDKRPLDHEVIRSVNAYIVTYFLIFAASLVIISLDTYLCADGMNEMVTNFTAVLSAMNNIGPGLEMVGPAGSFAFFSPLSKLVLIFDMLAGRLELFPMLLLFSPTVWKK